MEYYITLDKQYYHLQLLSSRACERSVRGVENGAEQAENGMSGREQSGERVLKKII